MYIVNYPEDSTLRRHHDSAAAFRHQAFLALPPTDSVLRRHHQQRLGAATEASTAPPRHTKPVASSPVAPVAAAPTSSGGLLGWLKRLFA